MADLLLSNLATNYPRVFELLTTKIFNLEAEEKDHCVILVFAPCRFGWMLGLKCFFLILLVLVL